MKNRISLLFLLFVGLSGGVITSCNEHKNKPAPETVKAEYQCPMKCSEQIFDKPGKCPVCGMELERVTKG